MAWEDVLPVLHHKTRSQEFTRGFLMGVYNDHFGLFQMKCLYCCVLYRCVSYTHVFIMNVPIDPKYQGDIQGRVKTIVVKLRRTTKTRLKLHKHNI